ncbi:MAG: triose-phosphate isomerase [Rickettsiales bacterium]
MSLLVANWKMHGSRARVRAFAYAVNDSLARMGAGLEVVFCPPAPYLAAVREALPQNARLGIGAQNCHAEREGAFTGEISAAMLADCGARHVILGHSERRRLGFETCAEARAKAEAAIAAGLRPIICVGESMAEYDARRTGEVLAGQVAHFTGLPAGKYVIAYEPVWAIGAGKTPTLAEISAAHRGIKSTLGSANPVLYGGSVNAGNLREILGLSEVQGALIGGASLEIDGMRALMEIAA